MDREYKKANDWLCSTGQGILEEGGDIQDKIKKMYPYFYQIHPIMKDRPSVLWLWQSVAFSTMTKIIIIYPTVMLIMMKITREIVKMAATPLSWTCHQKKGMMQW
jgi:hypothetical protein